MEWDELYKELNNIKIDFDRSYKSLSRPRPAQQNTVNKHAEIICSAYTNTRSERQAKQSPLVSGIKIYKQITG